MTTGSVLKQVEAVAHAFRQVHAGRAEHVEAVRIAEALLFASAEPLGTADLAERLPGGVDPAAVLADLERQYGMRGVNLVSVAGKWAFRTAPDLAAALARPAREPARPSRAAMEVLAIIAYHQPATRAEIEEIRGVATSKGTLDALLASGWVRLRGRRASPGRPVVFGTTPVFLDHFGLDSLRDLPELDELKRMGLGTAGLPCGSQPGGALGPDAEIEADEDGAVDADDLAFGPASDPA